MTRARARAGVGALLLWWTPSLAIMAIRIAPHVVAAAGAPDRIRRARRLIVRGRVAEAKRVVDALWRDRAAVERWHRVERP